MNYKLAEHVFTCGLMYPQQECKIFMKPLFPMCKYVVHVYTLMTLICMTCSEMYVTQGIFHLLSDLVPTWGETSFRAAVAQW